MSMFAFKERFIHCIRFYFDVVKHPEDKFILVMIIVTAAINTLSLTSVSSLSGMEDISSKEIKKCFKIG